MTRQISFQNVIIFLNVTLRKQTTRLCVNFIFWSNRITICIELQSVHDYDLYRITISIGLQSVKITIFIGLQSLKGVKKKGSQFSF